MYTERTSISDLRLLLNLLFYHFNGSGPTYKSQRMKLPDVIAAYLTACIPGLYLIESKGPVKLIKRVKIAHSFLQSVSN